MFCESRACCQYQYAFGIYENRIKLFEAIYFYFHVANIHWIGLEDGVIENVWKWSGTDNVATFTSWYTPNNEPNQGSGANCAVMYDHYAYNWADEPCTNRLYRPLCEKK